MNTSLLGPLVSENFINDAVSGSASYPKNGNAGTVSAAAADLNIAYDAPSNRYTVSTAGRSQSFAPANIDGSIVSPQITVYKKVGGNLTETLTLTKPGTSGSLTYKFVGAGFWQRTTDGSTAVSGTLDSFTYGVSTPAAAVPRSGIASYSVDLLGTTAYLDGPVAMRGTGLMLIRFGSGTYALDGTYDEINPATGTAQATLQFGGQGNLSGSSNGFSGTFNTTFRTGTLAGRFYGPQAQELGAAFRFAEGNGVVGTGTITGRVDSLVGDLAVARSFLATGSVLSFTTDSGGAVVGYDGNAKPLRTYAVDANGQRSLSDDFGVSATFADADRVAAESNAVFTSYKVVNGNRTDTLLLYNPGSGNTQLALSYASFGYWRQSKPNVDAGKLDVADRFFAYGIKTPADLVPKSGTGTYSGSLYGRAIAVSFFGGSATINAPVQFEVGGTIRLDFDFGAQSLAGAVNPTLTNLSDRTTASWGSYTIAGGTIFNANGVFTSNYSGNSGTGALFGNLYGPNADEAAGSFSMSAPFQAFGNVSGQGVFVAKKN